MGRLPILRYTVDGKTKEQHARLQPGQVKEVLPPTLQHRAGKAMSILMYTNLEWVKVDDAGRHILHIVEWVETQ